MAMTEIQQSALRTANDLFRNFAVDSELKKNAKAVAMFVPDGSGKIGRVVENKSDHVRGLFSRGARSLENAKANEDTRTCFKSLILTICGVKDVKDLPSSIRSAMKLGDYGKGKPLTARRIAAVMKALDKFASKNVNNKGDSDYTVNTNPRAAAKITDATVGSSTVKTIGLSNKSVVRQNDNLFMSKGFELDLDDDEKKL